VLRLGNRLLGAPLDDTRRDGAPLGGGLLDPVALAEVGASLGSDVPFFLGDAGLSWGRGRGERLEPLAPLPDASVVVVMPPVHVATGSAYAALARGRVVGGHPPCSGTFPDAPASWAEVAAAACNAFEAVIPATHPPVERALAALRAAGAAPGLLAGSGGACFGIFAERAAAEAAAAALRRSLGWPVEVTRTLSALPDGLALPAG
jgi:4-diphosphocytidyl-2-C-methyl-D-erythritol kinase